MKQTNVRVPELEREVETKLRVIVQKANLAAAQATSMNSKEGLVFLFQGCHQAAQSLIDSVNTQLQISANTFVTARGLHRKDEERDRLAKTIQNGEEKIINLSAYARKNGSTLKRRLLSLLIILLSVGDSLFNQRGFERLFSLNYIGSLIVSAAVAAMLAYLAHEAIPKYILSPNGDRAQRMKIVIGIAVGAFFTLSMIRLPGLPTMSEMPQLIAFTVLSAASFLVASMIGIKLYESRPTQVSIQEEEAAKELEATKKEVEAAKEALKALDKNTEEQEAYTAALMEYGLSLKNRIVNETTAIFFDYLRSAHNNREPETNPDIYHFTRYPYDFETEVKPKRSGGSALPLLLAFFLMSVLFSCKPAAQEQGELAVTVLIDNTTPLRNLPDTGSLKRFAGLDKNIWQSEIRFEIAKLSDVDFESSKVHTLPGAVRWLSNYEERQQQIDSFSLQLSRSLTWASPAANADLNRSIIYRPLARHAKALRTMPYTRKYILVWSDLMHHENGSISFYGKHGKKRLRQAEQTEALFLQEVPLDDLSDITIIFIHQSDEAGNTDFVAASTFFSNFFAKYGADTRIAASLPTP